MASKRRRKTPKAVEPTRLRVTHVAAPSWSSATDEDLRCWAIERAISTGAYDSVIALERAAAYEKFVKTGKAK